MAVSKLERELVELTKSQVEASRERWRKLKKQCELHKKLFAMRFWEGQDPPGGSIQVETGDGATHVESYVAALFSRAPATEVGPDLSREEMDARVPQLVINRWLRRHRAPFEQAVRLAVLYPCAFLRVCPTSRMLAKGAKGIDRVDLLAVGPWDVVLDWSAADWDHQRWVGHSYQLPLAEARARWPKIAEARWRPSMPERFLSPKSGKRKEDSSIPSDLQTVTIVEFYDLVRGKLCFWSPNKDAGESAVEVCDIPLKMPGSERLTHPIVPLYFAYEPDEPVVGLSVLSRLYDALREKNILRSFTANCIRRDARLWLAKEGAFSPDAKTKLALGADGEVIEVPETIADKGLDKVILPIPVQPMGNNFTSYGSNVESDIARSSVLAPFTRGEPAGQRTTAEEIGLLAEYSASAVGKMALERDLAIVLSAVLCLAHLIYAEAGDAEIDTVQVEGEVVKVTGKMLDAEWVITALDQASTPMSRAIEQQRFLTMLQQGAFTTLKVPIEKVRKLAVRLELIPASFEEVDELVEPAAETGEDGRSDQELFEMAAEAGLLGPQGAPPLA